MADRTIHTRLSVTPDLATIPGVIKYGQGQFTDLACSSDPERAPIVTGIWSHADIDNGDETIVTECDESKFIIQGTSTWKDVASGKLLAADAGSMIWFPKGSASILVKSRGLVAFYTEASKRDVTRFEEFPKQLTSSLDELVASLIDRYVAENPKSAATFLEASKVLPGGNTRSVLYHDPFPLVLASGRDCHITSEDGREYIDFVSEYSAAVLGHSHPTISKVVEKAMAKGINLGGTTKDESKLATLLKNRIRSIEKIRFCNSGTEANTMALIVAMKYTKKKKILAFRNGYHGGFLNFGQNLSSTTVPFEFAIGELNDTEFTDKLVNSSLAAIIVEPMQSAGGMIPATTEFLRYLRRTADQTGAVLIFDEIVTARLCFNGLQAHHGVYPDMTTLGKFFGGGFSFGAFGGRNDIMDTLDPRNGQIFHSGTFNNNTFSMSAGVAACELISEAAIEVMNQLGDRLRDGINNAGNIAGLRLLTATGFGSMIGIHFAGPAPAQLRDAFFFHLLSEGIYIGRRGFISINMMHKPEHVTRVLRAVQILIEKLLGVEMSE